jgi:hypothetical protein
LQWRVVGANAADFSDEVIVQTAADVAAGDSAAFMPTSAPYRFYRVEIIDKVGGSHSTAVLHGFGKGTR